MFSAIASILTTRVGAAVGWGCLALVLAATGWLWGQNMILKLEKQELDSKITGLEVAITTLSEAVRQLRNNADALGMSLDGCLAAYDEYVEQQTGIQETVKQIKVRPRSEVKGVADEESSAAVTRKYHDLLGL